MPPRGKCRVERKRRFLPRGAKQNNKKQKAHANVLCSPHVNPPASCFYYVLGLGTASVWEFLPPEDVSNLLRVCSKRLPQDRIQLLVFNAIDQFATENETHLGRCCGCDWMRGLDFHPYSDKKCSLAEPFGVNKTIPMLHTPQGAWDLLDALVLTKKLSQPLCSDLFVPVVCPLATKEKPNLISKSSITLAMNEVYRGAGSRFFYNFKGKTHASLDYLFEHWDDISNSSCRYCKQMTGTKYWHWTRWNLEGVKRVRANCRKIYRPLKSAMKMDLQHVQLIPPPRCSRKASTKRFEGMVAGIAKGGVLCGLYLVNGYLPY